MRKVKFSHKILSSVLALLMIFTSFPVVNTYAATDKNLGQVSAITKPAEINDVSQSNIVVTYNDEITVDWVPKNADRAEDGWWVGINMTAPDLGAEILSNSKYKSMASYNSSLSGEKKFWDFRDSKDKKDDEEQYITLWSFVTEKKIADAIKNNNGILETQWQFDWNYDEEFSPEQTVTIKIDSSKVKLMKDGEQVYPVQPGTIDPINAAKIAVVDASDSANVTVSYKDTLALDWSDVDETTNMPRSKAGWWAGIKMTAPNGVDLTKSTYQSKAYGSESWSADKKFDDYKDGVNYITLWAFVDLDSINNALSVDENIETAWTFDWNNDGIVDQTVTTSINPSKVVLNKDNKIVYPSTDLGTVTGITGSPKIEKDKTNSVTVTYDKEVILQWSQASDKTNLPRPKDGWWAGIKMTAPQGADLENAKYKSKASSESKWVENKEFAKAKDGDDFITLWAYVADEDMLKKGINTQWGFDWDNDGVYEQYVDFKFDSTTVKLDYANLYAMDKNAPVFGDDINNKDEKDVVWVNDPVTISGSVEDFDEKYSSEIKEVYYAKGEHTGEIKPDGAVNLDLEDSKFSFEVTDDYQGWYTIVCIDNAGNTATQKVYVRIDNTAPEFKNVTPDITEWKKGNITIEGIVSDDLSKVKSVEYSQGEKGVRQVATLNVETGVFSFEIPSNITYSGEYYIYCTDNAGKEKIATVTVNIDNEKCLVLLNDISKDWTKEGITIVGTIRDDHSGIGSVFYRKSLDEDLKNPENILESKEDIEVKPNADGSFLINLPKDDYAGNYTVYGKDKVGNVSNGVTFEVNMDKTAPVVNSVEVPDDWTNHNVTIKGTVSDNLSQVKAVFYKLVGDENWSEAVLDEDGKNYSFEIKKQNYNDVVQVYCIDNAENESEIETITLYMDTEAPSPVEITYSDKHNVLETITNTIFWFFNPDKEMPCDVTLTSTDNLSGIKSFEYSYGDVSSTAEISTDENVPVEKDGTTILQASAKFTIPAQFKGQVTASATDNSGNTSEKATDDKTIVVDDIAPGISVSYPAPANTNGDIDYYSNDVIVTVTVEEENFMDGEYKSEVSDMEISAVIEDNQEKTTTETYKITDWERVENTDKWEGTFALKTEGDYTLTIDYTDKSGNKADTYTRENLTIDKTSPVVTINYDNNQVSENALNNTYFNANRTATITVVEHNFAPEYIDISIIANDILTAQDEDIEIRTAVAKQLEYIVVYDKWNHNGNTHTFELKYADDAIYDFALSSFKDYALNEMNPNDDAELNHKVIYAENTESPEHFVVDATKPSDVVITYSEKLTVFETISNRIFWFFNPEKKAPCKVTLTTTDETSGVQYFDYSYDVNDVVNTGNEGKAVEKAEVTSREGSTYKCEFEIPAQFRGQVTASATDNSGNTSNEVKDGKNIVVDTIAPGLEVAYSDPANPAEKNKNKINYYSGDVTVTLTVYEENFMDGEFAEEVKDIIITADIIDENNNKTNESYVVNNWKRVDNTDKWIGSFVLSTEGDYTLNISYADKSGNEVSYNNINDNYKISIDKTAPVVEIAYKDSKNENRVGEDYFTNRTATITVVEHNFSPEYIDISIIANDILTAQDEDIEIRTAATKQLKDIVVYDKWNHNGNTHTFELKYADDAIYDFALSSFKDYALNEMNPNDDAELNHKVIYAENTESPEHFVVDATKPSNVVITYTDDLYKKDSSVLETIINNLFWFYNPNKGEECWVTLTTIDMTSGLQYFSYLYGDDIEGVIKGEDVQTKNINNAKVLKEIGFANGENDDGEKILSEFTYSFKIPAQFRGKVKAWATDNSGNETENKTVSDKTIVVDTDDPELEVAYSDAANPANTEKNKTDINYYSDDVTVTLTVDEENFMDGEFPKDVRDIIIKADILGDDNKTVTKESYQIDYWTRDKETNKWQGTFTLSTEGDYTLNISYADKSRNEISYTNADYPITIDKNAPIVSVSYDNNEVNPKSKYADDKNIEDKYYFDKARTATITVVEHNFAPEYVVSKIIANDILTAQDEDIEIRTAVAKQLEDIVVYDKWNHNGNTHTFDLKYVDDAIYDFKLTSFTDYALNEMNPNKNDAELNHKVIYAVNTVSPEHFVVDATKPSDVVITYSEKHSVLETITGSIFWFFNPLKTSEEDEIGKCTVYLTTTDMTSGLQYFSYSYNGNDKVVTENTNGGKSQEKGWTQDKEDLSKFTYSFEIPAQFRGQVTATATDNSGNTSKEVTDDKTIVVDTIAPGLEVAYSDAANPANTGKNKTDINYYSDDVTVTLIVGEENFMDGEFPEDVRDIIIKADILGDDNKTVTKESYQIAEWTRIKVDGKETDKWTGSFVLSTEGDYTLNISYADKSKNVVSYNNIDDNYKITIDKTAPKVKVEFDSIKPIHTIDGREYYNTNRSAVITVTEHNFFPEYFETENILKAQNILGNEVTNYIKYFKDEKNWTTDSTGNVHTIKVDFKSDANYTFDFEFEDLALNKSIKNSADDYTGYLFTVDKTAPKNLKVSYSANVYETVINAITFGYYDSKMTVTISADDETTGVYHFMYSYLTANDVSNVNAQLVNDAINRAKITQNGKTSTATFTIPKSSLERNSQFNGTVEFTAYDYAENNTYRDDTKRVVVDNISPTSTITFNEPVQNANNVSYYAGNIDATISINEANFYSQDVEVIVTKDGSRHPVSVNWTDNSVDSHTGTFRLTEDGDYVVRVVYSDRSGNAMATYESNQLTIDTVDPVITVSGLNHQSANNGETIGFSISVTDKNIALSEFKPVLTAVIRNDNGELETITISLGDPVTSTNDRGETVYTYTVQNLSVDGFYSLTCSAVDYANHSVNLINSGQDNGTSANEETMNFSVNREGSTFWIETTHNDKYSSKTFTNELDKAYANDNVKIVVHELNVDQVNISNNSDEETVFALHDGSSTGYVTLQEGSGSNGNYVKNTLRGEGGWYETSYTLNNDNFAHDGVYSFSILSYDRAGNSNLNTKDDSGVIKFTVDRTNPVITSNISTDQVIDADSHTVEFEINDTNHDKNTVEVMLNGKPVPSESITSLGGNSYSFEMSTGSKQSVSVTSKDLAGNTADQYEINDVTISTNRFVLFYYSHTLLFWIIVAGIVLLAFLILFIVFRRKKDEDEDEEKA